jgi:cell wall-associated NlpC family hydrolase
MQFDKIKSDEISQSLLGMSFELGGRGPKTIDCYGVLKYFFSEFGLKLPDYSYVDDWGENSDVYLQNYAECFRKLDKDETLEIGDVILFNSKENPGHAGVYLGESRFVHAYRKAGTKIDSLVNPVWKGKIYGYFRIKEV